MKRKILVFALIITLLCCGFKGAPHKSSQIQPSLTGKMVYHSYVDYSDKGSNLFVYDFATGKLRNISTEIAQINSGLEHAMNGHFNSSSTELVFMAMELNQWGYDHWYVYQYNLETGKLTNLVTGSEYNYEDPKYSPDGNYITMKRRIWKNDDWSYSLVEMNLRTKKIKVLVDNGYENSMPYYSQDGNRVYYAQYDGTESQIYSVNRTNLSIKEEYAEQGVYAYYPVVRWSQQEEVYFSKWESANNQADKIAKLTSNSFELLPFNTQSGTNYSDASPVEDQYMIFSSTENGSYDLYIADCKTGSVWSLDLYAKSINSIGRNELGAHYSN